MQTRAQSLRVGLGLDDAAQLGKIDILGLDVPVCSGDAVNDWR